jgi:hypothetical protein
MRKHVQRFGIEGAESLHVDGASALERIRDLRDTFVDPGMLGVGVIATAVPPRSSVARETTPATSRAPTCAASNGSSADSIDTAASGPPSRALQPVRTTTGAEAGDGATAADSRPLRSNVPCPSVSETTSVGTRALPEARANP